MRKIITILCVVCYFLPHLAVWGNAPFENHLLYMFLHANIFHILANLLALSSLKKLSPVTLLIAIISSFLPYNGMVVGLSGVIFAQIGIDMGYTFNKKGILQNILTAGLFEMLPDMAVLIHIYCLLIGFISGYVLWFIFKWRKPIGL